ncbi:hypothetical protein DL764_010168 [Monosporascus ibericus]|uniref:Prion-inhibition and propagation HeLo domain-containing protein n=1 Tax=Monosporascus ibericus TaxID=155417 RepID=A0A4Q4SV09_9PEZI|nr:hypothetical protein DL764_010168 [Monosporascus ibericus]
MEAASLAVGIASLATVFNNAVECFEYVQLGRSLGTNFQTSVLKLDNARLRLSRWGSSVGLSGHIDATKSLQSTILPPEAVPKAEQLLGHIVKLFTDAEHYAAQFKKPDDHGLLVQDLQTDLNPVVASLHQKMRELSIRRQNGMPLSKKIKWALYDERRLKELIDSITGLTNDLVSLFPAVKEQEQLLCNEEVSEFSESFRILKKVAEGQDEILAAALSDLLKPVARTNEWNNYSSKVGVQQDSNTGTITLTF